MPQKSPPERTLERKKREALALKANMKRRKGQVESKLKAAGDKPDRNPSKP